MNEELVANVEVLTHSSIRIAVGGAAVYFDPYEVARDYNDASVVFITHDHYDHFSPDDLARVLAPRTTVVCPTDLVGRVGKLGVDREHVVGVRPGEVLEVCGIPVEVVAAYNVGKSFHPRSRGWVGYVVTLGGVRYYVAGDTDDTPEARAVTCDVALVPVGGTYTMTATEAAALVNAIHPKVAIPTHYGTVAGTPADGPAFVSAVNPTITAVEKLAFA